MSLNRIFRFSRPFSTVSKSSNNNIGQKHNTNIINNLRSSFNTEPAATHPIRDGAIIVSIIGAIFYHRITRHKQISLQNIT